MVLRDWSGKPIDKKKKKKRRHIVERLVAARNEMEAAKGKKREDKRQVYENMKHKYRRVLSAEKIEKNIPIESYKNVIKSQIGPELDGGAAIVVNLYHHYVRLEAVHDDYVVVDDPGSLRKSELRANRKVTWDEARHMGYFMRWLVIKC